MSNEKTIRIYFPIRKEKDTTKIISDFIFLSKETSNGSKYYTFDINTFKFKKIQNLMGYLLKNEIHALKATDNNLDILKNIETVLKKQNDEDSLLNFESFINDSELIQKKQN